MERERQTTHKMEKMGYMTRSELALDIRPSSFGRSMMSCAVSPSGSYITYICLSIRNEYECFVAYKYDKR